jgi:hypothetical protein
MAQGNPAGLTALAREAEARGLGLIAAKARNLLRDSASSPSRRAKKEEKEISL